jgi:hypothetical protein
VKSIGFGGKEGVGGFPAQAEILTTMSAKTPGIKIDRMAIK